MRYEKIKIICGLAWQGPQRPTPLIGVESSRKVGEGDLPLRTLVSQRLVYSTKADLTVPQSRVVGAPPLSLHTSYEPSSYSVILLSYNLEVLPCSDPMLSGIELMLFNIDLIYFWQKLRMPVGYTL